MSDELLDLVHRYATYADERRLDELAGLFTEDGALITPGGEFVGPPAIRAHLDVLHRIERTEHLVATADFAVDDEKATGRVAAEAHHVNGTNDHVWTLTYLDAYVRTVDGWRIARREIDLISTADRPVPSH